MPLGNGFINGKPVFCTEGRVTLLNKFQIVRVEKYLQENKLSKENTERICQCEVMLFLYPKLFV